MKTNLDLIKEVDVFSYDGNDASRNSIWSLIWEDAEGAYSIGYILDRVVKELLLVPQDIIGRVELNADIRIITLFQDAQSEPERTAQAAKLADYLRQQGTFPLLKGWRNELWPVYSRKGELLFSMERAAIGLLGTMRYGVHMIAYIRDPSAPYGIKFWVPRRAATKTTFPGMLDNTVAGGLATGEVPFECLIREADEEASLPEPVVRSKAKLVDVVTYIYITEEERVGEADFIYPECQWVYDLELPSDVTPQPKDGEVDEFMLCDVEEVRGQLARGEYKPNCALVVIDFLMRHGMLTEEEEPELKEIGRRIHREISFPGPHKDRGFGWLEGL